MDTLSELPQLWAAEPVLFALTLFVVGACLGSFLTVVVARLPVMMMREAESEARSVLGHENTKAEPRFGLAWPASHCPACKRRLRWYENVPLFSFAAQRGRCRGCGTRLAWRYPALEILAGAVAVAAVAVFGPTLQGLAGIAMLLALLAIAFIDLEHQLIPDAISLPLLWLGLVANASGLFVPASSAILGAAAGYGVLWLISAAYRTFARKDALGQGDLKLAAMIGAWVGIGALPGFFIIAFLIGAAIGLGLMFAGRARLASAIPFGPFLAAGGAASLLLPELNARLLALYLP